MGDEEGSEREEAKFLGDLVAILEPDHLPQGKGGLGSGAVSVAEVHAGLVRGVAVGDETQGAIFRQGASGLAQSYGGSQGIVLRGDVIGRDLMVLRVEKQEGVLPATRI